MKIDWTAFVVNPIYQVGGVIAILVLIGLAACGYESCGKRHEQAAAVEGAQADASARRLKDALQEIEGLHRKVSDLEAAGRAYKLAYEQARARIPAPVVIVPQNDTELADALHGSGFKGAEVRKDLATTVFTSDDAGLAYVLSQRAKRAESLELALAACDELQKAQDATLKAKDLELTKTNEALRVSMEESAHRQQQALELGRALRVEHGKRWTKYAWGAAGLVVGAYATKH